MSHIVFVDSNLSGLNALKFAKSCGYEVTFIKSPFTDSFYKHDSEYQNILKQIDRVIDIEDTSCDYLLVNTLSDVQKLSSIDAILCLVEEVTLPLSKAASKLNIPFTNSQGVENARNKGICKAKLHEHKLDYPRFVLAHDEASIMEVADSTPFPLVFKPSKGTASMFARIVYDPRELLDAFRSYRNGLSQMLPEQQIAFSGDAIIEEYLQGRLLSLEIGRLYNQYLPITILERKRYSKDETIELGSFTPAKVSPEEWDRICNYGIAILQALNLDMGVFHLEMILTNRGPVLIDANPRIMGGSGPVLINHTYDFNIYELLIKIHLGLKVEISRKTPTRFGVSHVFGLEEDAVVANGDLSWLSEYSNYLQAFNLRLKPDQFVKKLVNGFDYFGYLVITSESHAHSFHLCDEIIDRLSQTLQIPFIK